MTRKHRGPTVDRDDLHAYLFSKADRLGRVVVVQRRLAQELDLSYQRMNMVMIELETAGRIRKLHRHRAGQTYIVADPERWKQWAIGAL